MSEVRTCLACGGELASTAVFCSTCGARQEEETGGAEALIGQLIDGRFRVLRLLGTGGMGAVYLAEHAGIGRRVAVKVLRYELRDQKDLVRRFRREITAVSRLADAHTVTVFDSGMWRGLAYLVMEYLRGVDLASTLDVEGRLSLERAVRITCQIGSSLAEAHQQGIVHRDLKPENIFLTRSAGGEELVKVLDFGLAKIVSDESPGETTFQTQKGILLGTPYYMAPEQIEGGEVGPATDLYALGALLFRMLAGRPAFAGHSPMQVLESHLKAERPVLDVPRVPPEVAALVGRMLARAPADRPRRALDVVGILLEFLPGERTPDWALATAPHERPPEVAPLRVPSSFSTSAIESAPEVLADHPREEPGDRPEDSLPAATRDEFARYERQLGRRWRRRLLLALAGAAVVGGIALVMLWPSPPPTREVEPNDDPHTASPLQVGLPLRGFLGRRLRPEHSDLDYFRLAPSTGSRLARVSGVPGIDLVLDGFDTAGQRVVRINGTGVGQGEAGPLPGAVAWLLVRELWVAGQPPSENSTDAYLIEIIEESGP